MSSRPLSTTAVVRTLLIAACVVFLVGVGLLAYAGRKATPDTPLSSRASTSLTADPRPSTAGTSTPASDPTPVPTTTTTPSTPSAPSPPSAPQAGPGTAAAVLASLVVAGESGGTYDRADFLVSWLDADHDGCDTRREVLIAESRIPVTRTGTCTVSAGEWLSYVDGAVWTNPADVDIDHTVPLKEAFQSGAATWTAARRSAFANDLGYDGSLNAITDNVNASKSDRDPAEWLPSGPAARCEYAVRYVTVKARWSLTVDPGERAALANVLTGDCGARPISVTLAP